MLKFFLYLGVFWKAQCVFFDLTDIEDPASYFLSNRVSTRGKETCFTSRNTEGTLQGRCLHAAKCLLSRGVIRGSCGIGSSCCVYRGGCNSETREKVSYFSGSYNAIPNPLQTSFCSYKIHLLPNTCQVRLDIQKFVFNPPTAQTTTAPYKYACVGDSMTVTPNHYFIPALCGNNNKQHVYIHLNRTIDSEVTLQMNFGDRSSTSNVQNPEWDIKITQLECKATFDVLHPDKKNIDEDLLMLAPLGALQYFTDSSGTFRTFGIEENPDSTVTNPSLLFTHTSYLRYAIAFKRYPNICGVGLTATYFYIGTSTCSGTSTASTATDYIFAPEAVSNDGTAITNSKFCRQSTITTSPPGPLYVYFSSTTYPTKPTAPWGFVINYNLLPCSYQVN